MRGVVYKKLNQCRLTEWTKIMKDLVYFLGVAELLVVEILHILQSKLQSLYTLGGNLVQLLVLWGTCSVSCLEIGSCLFLGG